MAAAGERAEARDDRRNSGLVTRARLGGLPERPVASGEADARQHVGRQERNCRDCRRSPYPKPHTLHLIAGALLPEADPIRTSQLANDATGIPGGKDAFGDVSRDHAAGANHRA